MSEFIRQLRHQAKNMRKGGATGRADLFDNAANEIEQLQQRVGELEGNTLPDDYIAVPADEWHRLVNVEGERDSLEAHIERINSVLDNEGKTVDFEYCPDQFQIDDEVLESVLSESPQTSLAEVRAKQAKISFLEGFYSSYEGFNGEYKASWSEDNEISLADEHANKIRNGDTD